MKKKLLIMVVSIFMLLPVVVSAKAEVINVGGKDLYIATGTKSNDSGTAVYNGDTKILTLNNYNGGVIKSDANYKITINLIGTNKIINNKAGYEPKGLHFKSDLEITGTGSLELQKMQKGIHIENGNLMVTNASITMNDMNEHGIYVQNGNFNIKGNLNINSNDIGIELSNDINVLTINGGNIKIISSDESIYGGSTVINDGNIALSSDTDGIDVYDFTMNDGKLVVSSLDEGIESSHNIKVNGGYLDIESDESAAVFAENEVNSTKIAISDKMEILPKGTSIQNYNYTTNSGGIDYTNYGTTLGTAGASRVYNAGLYFNNNTKSSVIIREKEVVPETYDGIGIIFIILAVAILGFTILFLRKRKING